MQFVVVVRRKEYTFNSIASAKAFAKKNGEIVYYKKSLYGKLIKW